MIKKLVLISVLFSQILFAQQNDLSIDVQPVTGSNVNWETTLYINAQNGMESGILIEAPLGLKLIPVTARINQNDMFLQNTGETPSIEDLICWDLSPEGLMLFFREGQFNSGDQIVIKTMTTRIKKPAGENPAINIRTIQKNNQDILISDDIKSTATLSLENEN